MQHHVLLNDLTFKQSVRNSFDATYFAPVALIDNKEPIRELHAEGTRLEEVPLSLGW